MRLCRVRKGSITGFTSFRPGSAVKDVGHGPVLPLQGVTITFYETTLRRQGQSSFRIRRGGHGGESSGASVCRGCPLCLRGVCVWLQCGVVVRFAIRGFLSFGRPTALSLTTSTLGRGRAQSSRVIFRLRNAGLSLLGDTIVCKTGTDKGSGLIGTLSFFG